MNTDVRKRRWLKGVAFVFVFLVTGFVIGVGATLLYMQYRFQRTAPQRDAIVSRMLESMDERVDGLAPDERERLAALLDGHFDEILAVREQSFQSMQEIFGRVDEDVEKVLGPERFKNWYDYKEQRMSRWRDRYGHHGQSGQNGMRGGGMRGQGMGMGHGMRGGHGMR